MFGSFFDRKPLLDEATKQWLFDCYAWALRQFDADVFSKKTVLVLPNDRFFPGRVNSVEGMANHVLEKVKEYAALAHWPILLSEATQCTTQEFARPVSSESLRGDTGNILWEGEGTQQLPVYYDPALVNNPEAMIASLSHQLAHHLAGMAKEPPPRGEASLAQATEVLAVFMGFGLMFANSAFNVRIPRCGSCAPQPADRQSFLSQYDTTYALAIFCILKGIQNSAVLPHLKAPLRGFYKKSVKDISTNESMARLRQIF